MNLTGKWANNNKNKHGTCCGLKVCLPQDSCWCSSLQSDRVWRRGLWECLGLHQGHKSGTLVMTFISLQKEEEKWRSLRRVWILLLLGRVFIYISSSWFIVLFKSSVSLPILCLVFLSIHMHWGKATWAHSQQLAVFKSEKRLSSEPDHLDFPISPVVKTPPLPPTKKKKNPTILARWSQISSL